MYHIKKDKRSEKSANYIYSGLIKCLKSKPYKDITITEIQQTSYVGRATFYRLFDSKDDVLLWKCDQAFKEVFEKALKSVKPMSQEFLLMFFDFWYHHASILKILVSAKKIGIIYQCCYNNAKDLFETFTPDYGITEKEHDYYLSMLIGSFIALLIRWIINKRKETPQELVELITKRPPEWIKK